MVTLLNGGLNGEAILDLFLSFFHLQVDPFG